jgi:hypothetical protein
MSASHVQIAELIEVSLDDINIPPGNHRQDLGDLNGLAESIRTIGLVQPITCVGATPRATSSSPGSDGSPPRGSPD